jgi:hypothetical protein
MGAKWTFGGANAARTPGASRVEDLRTSESLGGLLLAQRMGSGCPARGLSANVAVGQSLMLYGQPR